MHACMHNRSGLVSNQHMQKVVEGLQWETCTCELEFQRAALVLRRRAW